MNIGLGLGLPFARSASFDVASLFGASEPGVWFDPSDFSTMWQDSAGTTPVTAVEQPVGLWLDKSKGAQAQVLFAAARPDMVAAGTTPPTVNNAANFLGSAVTSITFPSLGAGGFGVSRGEGLGTSSETQAEAGAVFRVRFRVALSRALTGVETVTVYATGASATDTTILEAGSANGVWLDTDLKGDPSKFVGQRYPAIFTSALASPLTVYVREYYAETVRGNHATQATSASRPVLSARANLLTATDGVLCSPALGWAGPNISGALQADGSSLVARTSTTANAYSSFAVAGAIGARMVARIKVKKATVGNLYALRVQGTYPDRVDVVLNLDTGAIAHQGGSVYGLNSVGVSLGADGFYVVTADLTVAGSPATALIHGPARDASGAWEATSATLLNAYAKEPDLRLTSDTLAGPAYQRVNTGTDYETAGFKHFLKFDGVDDSLATGSINFTGTDKMTVFAGVHKASDAAVAILCELSADTNANAGSFYLAVPESSGGAGNFSFRSKGSLGAAAAFSGTMLAPTSKVVTGVGEISTDTMVVRVNGAQAGTNTGDQGTGTYGNYPLYIGRRGGSSLPFNGRLYSLIVRGAATNDAQIAAAERWVNARTGAYA